MVRTTTSPEPRSPTDTPVATDPPEPTESPTPTDTAAPAAAHDSDFTDTELAAARKVGTDAKPSVVVIRNEFENGHTTGTGWALDSNTIVSNGHVVEGSSELSCWLPDGSSFTATVAGSVHGSVGKTGHADIGVLRTDRRLQPLTSGSSDELVRGQPLVQVGHPGLVGNWVVSLGRYLRQDRFFGLLSTAPTMGGSSGSPILDTGGNVVGVTAGQAPRQAGGGGRTPTVSDLGVQTSFEEEIAATHTPIETIEAFVESL